MGKKLGIKSVTIRSTGGEGARTGFIEKVKMKKNGKISALKKDGKKSSVHVGKQKIHFLLEYSEEILLHYRSLPGKVEISPDGFVRPADGIWEMKIVYEDGRVLRASYAIGWEGCGAPPLSRFIRRALKRDDLFLLDGEDVDLTGLTVHLFRTGGGRPAAFELLSIDFIRERVKLDVYDEQGRKITVSLQNGAIESLRKYPVYRLENPAVIDPDETYPEGSVLYYLTLEGASGGKADVASGRYDRAHLPRNWGNFMKVLSVFLPISSYSMLLDKSLYSKRTEKREGDYTYCDVSYEEGGSLYCYLCDIDEVHPGDYVRVPVGPDYNEIAARVEDVYYGTKEDTPYPFHGLKHILGVYVKAPRDEEEGD